MLFFAFKINTMFIRKRGENYQAVISHRENGKVKQDVLSLGKHSTVQEALKRALLELEVIERQLTVPVSEYKETKYIRGLGLCTLSLTTKRAEKRHAKWLDMQYKQKLKVSRLESLASLANKSK